MNSLRIILVKLASIGDIAAACQALLLLSKQFDLRNLKFHWIIDAQFIPLAKELLKPCAINVEYHALSAALLFKGSIIQKLLSALKMLWLSLNLKADYIQILHRDRRYRWLLKLSGSPFTCDIAGKQGIEAEQYLQSLQECMMTLGTAKLQEAPIKAGLSLSSQTTQPRRRIGVLVGGARNQNVRFDEKRWPHFKELVALILRRTDYEIELFGGPDDTLDAQEIIDFVSTQDLPESRIQNQVGKLKLADLPQSIGSLKAFVSIDSGLAHIAAAAMPLNSQKVIVLFGPTDPKSWLPLSNGYSNIEPISIQASCSPCYKNDGKFSPCNQTGSLHRHCMRQLKPDDVFNALDLS